MKFEITEKGFSLGYSIKTNPYTERVEIICDGVSIEELETPLTISDLQEANVLRLK